MRISHRPEFCVLLSNNLFNFSTTDRTTFSTGLYCRSKCACLPLYYSKDVTCYYKYNAETGTCHNTIAKVSAEDCCLNHLYGFKSEDGECKSCRPASWSEWSAWSPCSVSCGKGIKERKRTCDGFGHCRDPKNLGARQTEACEDQQCCPEQGGWGQWGAWQPCSVTCGKGIIRRERPCNNPPPKCGGSCNGRSESSIPCEVPNITCPTQGGWTEWGNWHPCPKSCRKQGEAPPSQERWRTCTNPSPSIKPPGRPCPGVGIDTQDCSSLPICPVDGAWGAWGRLSECSVTCGIGLRLKTRKCDNPAPKYGGKPCEGDDQESEVCISGRRCPVHGEWSEWGEWGRCAIGTSNRPISCTNKRGRQRRQRECLERSEDGNPCNGTTVEHRQCYDVTDTPERPCEKPGLWAKWSEWSVCKPPCGTTSKQRRERECVAQLPEFEERDGDRIYYSGKPKAVCPSQNVQSKPCPDAPPC